MADTPTRPDAPKNRREAHGPVNPSARPGPHSDERPAAPRRRTLWEALFSPVDIGFLVYFRIVFGTLILANIAFYYAIDAIQVRYIAPSFHFTYHGFEWVRPWPGAIGVHLHFLGLGVLAASMVLGLFYRVSSLLFAIGFTHLFLIDKAYFQNHYYLFCLLSWLMVLLPAHRAFSLDSLRRPKIRSATVPGWTLWLLRFHIGLPYFFGGIAKLNSDWLAGEPMRSVLADMSWYPIIGPFVTERWCVQLFVQGGLWFDLLAVPALLWRPTRVYAFAVAVLFHLMNHMLFYIGVFPWFMIFATAVFFRPDWPRWLLRLPAADTQPAETARSWSRLSPLRKVGVVLLGAYVSFHVIWPLRHLAYEGNPSWTEQGRTFAWHMMLREKESFIRFHVSHPHADLPANINPLDYITPFQFMMMSNDPDMIQDFSHFLARELRNMGYDGVEVRALALVSLNGRKPQLLIDPSVDLAAEPRTFGRPSWIMPLTEPLREHRWDVPTEQWVQSLDLPPLSSTQSTMRADESPPSEPVSEIRDTH